MGGSTKHEPDRENINKTNRKSVLTTFAILSALALLLPLASIALISVWNSNNRLQQPKAVWVDVLSTDDKLREAVDIVLEWQPVKPIFAPQWTGMVTGVESVSPDGIHSGDAIARIDGVTRLAVHTTDPFFRFLSFGDRGPDVAMLNGVLRSFDLPATDGDLFTTRTLEGVRGLALSIGVVNASRVTAFDASWFVYLPAEGMTAYGFDLAPGSPAPPPGTEIVPQTLQLSAATLTRPDSVVIQPAGNSQDIDFSQPIIVEIPESARFVMPDGGVLEYAGLTLDIDDGSVLTPAAVAELSGSVDVGARSARGSAVVLPAEGSVLVPSAAVFAKSDGTLCITRQRTHSVEGVRITLISNVVGKSIIQGDVSIGDSVLVAPEAGQRACD